MSSTATPLAKTDLTRIVPIAPRSFFIFFPRFLAFCLTFYLIECLADEHPVEQQYVVAERLAKLYAVLFVPLALVIPRGNSFLNELVALPDYHLLVQHHDDTRLVISPPFYLLDLIRLLQPVDHRRTFILLQLVFARRVDVGNLRTVSTLVTTSQYTLTSSGSAIVVTSVITAVVTGADPAAPGSTGARTLNGANGGSRTFFNNTGAVAGVFVVVALLAAGIVIGLGFFFVRRKKRRQLDEDIRVAAGGAGDGGAGINRFDDDEESINGYAGQSDSHQSGYMSSLGAVPLTAAAAGFGTRRSSAYDLPTPSSAAGLATTTDHTSSFEPGNSPAQSQSAHFQPYAGGAASYGPQNNEGIFADDWAEYVGAGGVAGLATSGEGSAGGPGSQEGMMGSAFPHSADGHSQQPNNRFSGASFYSANGNPDGVAQDMTALRNSLYGLSSESPYAGSTSDRRDDRLDPNAIRAVDNGSATSLADDQDFSRRVLRVANPSND
ncbi:hypothetical protein JCM10295v2_003897 [Rhodotorula toruloides]